MPAVPDEFPPLGVYYVIGNSSDSQAFPIIGISFDMKKGGYDEPNFGDPIPTGANMPNNMSSAGFVFHKSTVTAPDQRIHFQYDLFPGPWIYDETVDPESLAITFEKRRNNIGANIIPGAKVFTGSGASLTAVLTTGVVTSVTINSGGTGYGEFVSIFVAAGAGRTAVMFAHSTNGIIDQIFISDGGSVYSGAPTLTVLPSTMQVTDRKNGRLYAAPEDMDFNVSHEVVTVTPQPLNSDISTALVSETTESISFPGICNYGTVNATIGGGQGIINLDGRSTNARNVPVNVLTYWVVSDTKPTVAWDTIAPTDVYFSRNVDGSDIVVGSISNVLHDAYTLVLSSGNESYLATVPSFTQYLTWIGTYKNIKGSITPDKYQKLWKVIIYSVKMQ